MVVIQSIGLVEAREMFRLRGRQTGMTFFVF